MTMYWFYIFVLYMFSTYMFFNFSNVLLFWIMMEVNLLCFSLIMVTDKDGLVKKDSLNYLMYYFIIQSGSSILFLSNFSFLDWGSIFNMDVVLLFSLSMKIGLFPFFFWIFSVSSSLDFLSLLLLLTIQKIPLFLILFCCGSSYTFFLVLLTFFLGNFLLLYSKSFLDMLVSSSIAYSLILFFFYNISLHLFFFFFLMYTGFVFLTLSMIYGYVPVSPNLIFLIFSFFLGLPPLGLFFFKLHLLSDLFYFSGYSEIMAFWFFTVLGLIGYLKFFYFSFFRLPILYYMEQNFLKMSIFLPLMVLLPLSLLV